MVNLNTFSGFVGHGDVRVAFKVEEICAIDGLICSPLYITRGDAEPYFIAEVHMKENIKDFDVPLDRWHIISYKWPPSLIITNGSIWTPVLKVDDKTYYTYQFKRTKDDFVFNIEEREELFKAIDRYVNKL